MMYDKIIIVGSNTVACNCLEVAYRTVGNDKIIAIETSENRFSMLHILSNKKGVRYECLCDATSISARLEDETDTGRTLVISANNRYIFRKSFVEKRNVTIVNFHYALLPSYRGINIPSWVIYNNEPYTGITWHFVTAEIDHGNILSQRRIDIGPDTTAYDIIKEGMRLSQESFEQFFYDLLEHHQEGKSVDWSGHEYIYLSKNLPNDGVIIIGYDNIDTIDRVLRAYDHHGLSVMAPLQIQYEDERYFVKKYSINEDEFINEETVRFINDCLLIHDKDKSIAIELTGDLKL